MGVRRHVDDINALKQRFAREKAMADDNYQRNRSIQTEAIMEQQSSLKDSEKETLSDLVKKQQRELNGVISIHMSELEKLREELGKDFEEWKEEMRQQVTDYICLISTCCSVLPLYYLCYFLMVGLSMSCISDEWLRLSTKCRPGRMRSGRSTK